MVAEPAARDWITEENQGMRAYPLFSFDPVRSVEVFYLEFDVGVRHDSQPHVKGVEEYIFMVKGALKMIIGGEEVVLSEKQSLRFQADVPHTYHNVSDEICLAYNMIFYPNE